MAATRRETLPIGTESDVTLVRQRVRDHAKSLGFRLVDSTRIVTAASELARNTLVHGGGGEVEIEELDGPARQGLRLVFTDRGPGIPDIALAMTDGYTSGGGLGMGLSGSRRLADEFEIASSPGAGTRVAIIKWK